MPRLQLIKGTGDHVSALRDKILNSSDIKNELVEVPEWGVKVEVRGMTGRQRAKFLEKFSHTDAQGNEVIDYVGMTPRLVIACSYDPEDGSRIFTEDDMDAVNDKSSQALQRVMDVALKLSGISKEAEAEAGNSSSSESGGSTSS